MPIPDQEQAALVKAVAVTATAATDSAASTTSFRPMPGNFGTDSHADNSAGHFVEKAVIRFVAPLDRPC